MKAKVLLLALVLGVVALGLVSGYADAVATRLPGKPAIASAAPAETPGPLDSPVLAVHGSPGCSRRGIEAGATLVRSLSSGGLSRTYRVHVSARAADGEPLPLVLNFHGRGGTGAAIEAYSGLLPLSDSSGFLLVSPDGTGSTTGWGAGASLPGWPVDDVQFGRDLLTALKQDFCVDSTRIYAVGHSNGAFMAARLACDLPGQIAAIAPVAGVYVPPEGCATPVPVLAFHGTADDVVPFGGGIVRETYVYRGTEREIADWAAADHCTGPASATSLNARVVVEHHGQCTKPVELVLIKGAGHGWPGMPGTDLASEVDTPNMIWNFLKNFSSTAE